MGEETGLTHLQLALRSLCFKTQWKYAVFWKLKHRTRMILTCEDAYYDNHEPHGPSDHMPFNNTLKNLRDGCYLQDPLGLAVVKMSYLIYSLGEGIIGQVAVTGKHQWIFADKLSSCSWTSSEYCDGWQSQFSAGIRTIAVVAVLPHGVVQLGSLNTVIEDMKLVTHIKDIFCALRNSSMEFVSNPLKYSMHSSLNMTEVSSQHSGLDNFNDSPRCSDKFISDKSSHIQSCLFPSLGTSNELSHNVYLLPHPHQNKPFEMLQHSGLENFNDSPHCSDKSISNKRSHIQSCLFPSLGTSNELSHSVYLLPHLNQSKPFEVFNEQVILESVKVGDGESTKLHKQKLAIHNLERERELQMNLFDKDKCGEENGNWSDRLVGLKHNDVSASYIHPGDNKMQQVDDEFGVDYSFLHLDLIDSTFCGSGKFDSPVCLQNEELQLHKQLKKQIDNGSKQKSVMDITHIDTANSSLTFSAGCELYEALGSAFKKEQINRSGKKSDKIEAFLHNETTDRMTDSHFTTESGSEYLLEAVVANVCSASSNLKSENSLCQSAESLLTTGKTAATPNRIKHCSSFSGKSFIHSSNFVKDGTYHPLKSILDSREVSAVRSSTESSLKTLSKHSTQSDLQSGPGKINRKRARPGESCRPRPRDRQLIQDRVKELRELVPNGSKCSIDSLLERTIKHMLFLQSVTKHADKLKQCAESKFHESTRLLGSCSGEHGSSWALDVESQTEACPVVVENLNMNGQMLVEMREDFCHFLEIAEVIRSLGLTILKGVTKVRGEKTWASFVVEGQNNRGMHRMDILWSLMQLLQPKATI